MNCYNQGVGEKLHFYSETLAKAKNVDIFSKSQSKESRNIKRVESPIQVHECLDQEEALMKLAFIAAEKGFRTLVDVELRSKKVGAGKAYKKLIWLGSGIPANPKVKK